MFIVFVGKNEGKIQLGDLGLLIVIYYWHLFIVIESQASYN